jgi:hypothetical protein
MLKRNFGSALRAMTRHDRRRDLRLRVLTHNIALALIEVFYRAGRESLIFRTQHTNREHTVC